jgi:hypothetical protein
MVGLLMGCCNAVLIMYYYWVYHIKLIVHHALEPFGVGANC